MHDIVLVKKGKTSKVFGTEPAFSRCKALLEIKRREASRRIAIFSKLSIHTEPNDARSHLGMVMTWGGSIGGFTTLGKMKIKQWISQGSFKSSDKTIIF